MKLQKRSWKEIKREKKQVESVQWEMSKVILKEKRDEIKRG